MLPDTFDTDSDTDPDTDKGSNNPDPIKKILPAMPKYFNQKLGLLDAVRGGAYSVSGL